MVGRGTCVWRKKGVPTPERKERKTLGEVNDDSLRGERGEKARRRLVISAEDALNCVLGRGPRGACLKPGDFFPPFCRVRLRDGTCEMAPLTLRGGGWLGGASPRWRARLYGSGRGPRLDRKSAAEFGGCPLSPPSLRANLKTPLSTARPERPRAERSSVLWGVGNRCEGPRRTVCGTRRSNLSRAHAGERRSVA